MTKLSSCLCALTSVGTQKATPLFFQTNRQDLWVLPSKILHPH
jgi:hypothetical protein